jgi:hypothetical protein
MLYDYDCLHHWDLWDSNNNFVKFWGLRWNQNCLHRTDQIQSGYLMEGVYAATPCEENGSSADRLPSS